MPKPNFFCGIEALQWLLQCEPKTEQDDIDLTVDLIEAPYVFCYSSDAEAWSFKALMRGELYDHEKGSGVEKGNLRVDKASGEGKGSTSDPALKDFMGPFFEACRKLSRYIRDENLQPLYEGLDPEQGGVMLEPDGDKLKARRVEGQDRPELMCSTLFGGNVMMRPYMEDFMDRSETEAMSVEEKIEKAEGGDKFAIATLAQAYLNGSDEVEQDPAKAAYWYRKEAELGESEGAFNLGLLYAKGFGVERDFEQAAEWMEKAVAWGDSDGEGPAKIYRETAADLKKAEAGDAEAMARLAERYMALGGSLDQAGADRDYAESLTWARKAVDAGCAAGCWPLALAYEHGRGVPEDRAQATEYYRLGAEGGNAACQHSYACQLIQGKGVRKDKKAALALFEKSAEQGYALACKALGHMYKVGDGVEPDFDKELDYFERACRADPSDAEFLRHVGYQYTNLMDQPDKWLHAVERAAHWLREAANRGDRVAAGGADMYEKILELHRQGVIPAGTDISACMGYLSGENKPDKAPAAATDVPAAPDPAHAEAPAAPELERPVTEIFDEHLTFLLPEGYEVDRSPDDNGNAQFNILKGVTVGDDGKKRADVNIGVVRKDEVTIDENSPCKLKGNFLCAVKASSQEANLAIFTVQVMVTVAAVIQGDNRYTLICTKIARDEDAMSENAEQVAAAYTEVLNGMVIDGEQAAIEPVTARFLLSGEKDAVSSEFRTATPGADQHSQLDFQKKTRSSLGFLGNLVQINNTGTEFSFDSIRQMALHSEGESGRILTQAAELDKEGFALAETAKEMAGLFRVNLDAFNPGHDREQEILGGLIQRAATYNGLRSFAWTLAAYCADKGLQPGELSRETLQELLAFLAGRKWLNYRADEFCSTLCSGNDIHVYYLSDAVKATDKQLLLALANPEGTEPSARSEAASLEGLRRDLAYIYPAVRTLYDALAEKRDRAQALEGDAADVVYAWCAAAYAAREPIFSEDGPINNFFSHPDEMAAWEERWRKEREEAEKKAAEAWMASYGKHVSHGPILFRDKKFVFAGVEGYDDWLELLEKLTAKGGVHRTAVSGKTDYLVCEPRRAGDSKVKAALEQNIKGKNVKIILAEDLRKALGMEKKEAPAEEAPTPPAPAPIPEPDPIPAPAPDPASALISTLSSVMSAKMTAPQLSYTQRQTVRCDDYDMDIPDGFRIRQNVDGRAFVAWLPGKDDPDDYHLGDIAIMDGKTIRNAACDSFSTPEEFEAMTRVTHIIAQGGTTGTLFDGMQYFPFLREDLAGGVSIGHDPACIHANAFFGMGSTLHGIRLQFLGVEDAQREATTALIREILDHVHVRRPIKLGRSLSDPAFYVKRADEALSKDWDDAIDNVIRSLGNARMLVQNALQNKARSGGFDLETFKKEIRSMLASTRDAADRYLTKAWETFGRISALNAGNPELLKMQTSLRKLVDFANQFVNLDGEKICENSALVKKLSPQLDTPEIKALRKEEEDRRAAEEKRKRQEKEKEAAAVRAYKDWNTARQSIEVRRESLFRQEFVRRNSELKQKAEAMRADYNEAYGATIERANELGRRQNELQSKIAAENQKPNKFPKIFTGWGVFQTLLGLACTSVGAVGIGIVNLVFGILVLVVGVRALNKTGKERGAMTGELSKVNQELAALPPVKSLAEFVCDSGGRYDPALLEKKLEIPEEECRALREQIERDNPIPPAPPKPASLNAASRTGGSAGGRPGSRLTPIQEAILECLSDGKARTVSDMIEEVPWLEDRGNQEVSAACRALVLSGKIEKFSERRRTYFRISG